MNNPVTAPTPIATPVSAPAPTRVQRLLSLDVVRGITIAFMIMVNNNGGPGSWRFMNHAVWNGLTPTDLVFPTFVFVVGVSVVFAFDARLARGATRAHLAWHTVQRAVVLFLLGIVVNSFPFFQLQHMRFYGVLQRIAVCYLVVGLFYLWDNRAWTKVVALFVALVGYWVLVRWIPIPGVGMPGRDVPFMDMTQNLVSWIDRLVFPHHLYLYAPDHNVRDPEGLLSDLPAIGTALLGVLTGLWLRSDKPASFRANGLAVAALSSLALGYLWALWFPLNKNMWTSSFVLVAAGYSLVLLAFAFWADWSARLAQRLDRGLARLRFECDCRLHVQRTAAGRARQRNRARWSEPSAGLNLVIFERIFAHIPDPHWAAFAYSVSFTAVCFVPVWILYRKKIFLKV